MSHSVLLERLEAVGTSLELSGHALALIGLGSVGLELARLDEHSDLDFFVIVEDGYKHAYLQNLDWLERLAPVTFCFQNTTDGYKLLFSDDVFCEFAVFEMHELANIPFAVGRVVWKKPNVPDQIATPIRQMPIHSSQDLEWQLGEALTNLYIGLKRFYRGEKLSASRFVQLYALDRLLTLADHFEAEQPAFRDVFSQERRFEQRFPNTSKHLAQFVQGYERTPESALAILDFLGAHVALHTGMATAIRNLVKQNQKSDNM